MEGRGGDTACPSGESVILQTERHASGVDVADRLSSTTDVNLVIVVLRGLTVDRVVEVHTLGVLPAPVTPDQVSGGAEQADDHYRNHYTQNHHCYVVTQEVVVIPRAVGEVSVLSLDVVGQ